MKVSININRDEKGEGISWPYATSGEQMFLQKHVEI